MVTKLQITMWERGFSPSSPRRALAERRWHLIEGAKLQRYETVISISKGKSTEVAEKKDS
jgi:hypothetical protein